MRKQKMKSKQKFKIICIWAMISLLLQTCILFYLSNYYFSDKTTVTFKDIFKDKQYARNDIKIPKDVRNISMSSSNRYAMYYLKNTLHVINLIDGKDNVVDLEGSLKDIFVKWYETEDKLIISEKKWIDGEVGIKIYTYQPKDNLKQEVLDCNNESRVYKLPRSSSQVLDIQLNSLNTIVYIKTSEYNSKGINRLDISTGMSKLPINTKDIGDYYILKQDDHVVFENIVSKKVFIFDSLKSKEVVIDGVSKSKLLYVDNQGVVYIGHLEKDKIKAIYYKNCNDKSNSKWGKYELQEPLDIKDIKIFGEEYIYAVNNINGIVTNLKNKKETKFPGRYIDMNYNGILSLKDESVSITNLK